MVYIRQSQLPKLKEYKYSGTLRDSYLFIDLMSFTRYVLDRDALLATGFALTWVLLFVVVAVDHSLLSRYVLKPYWWSQVINIFPMSMAPNAVSISCLERSRVLEYMVY